MRASRLAVTIVGTLAIFVGVATVSGQEAPPAGRGGGGGGRPARTPAMSVLKVEWRAIPGLTGTRAGVPDQVPVAQGHVTDANVELKQYGAGKKLLTANGDPSSVWSGECDAPFAITFRQTGNYLNLSGNAKIRWTTKTSGFHVVRPVVKLADGTMMVGDFASANVPMLAMTEFPVATIRWVKLDPTRVVTLGSPGNSNNEIWVQNPDLSKVDEVGFADLMPSSGHGAGGYIHVGSIEVFGQPVARTATR
ncbi:MAG: hypothetical protein AB7I50_10330 [Vicinamibacterales bacterium]